MQGQHDSPLSPTGVMQARLLAGRFTKDSFAALYSSDLGRAHQTARAIADVTGHEIRVDERLRERHFGVFEGLTGAEMKARYPDAFERFAAHDPVYVLPGGESAVQFRDRCVGALTDIASRHAGETIAVVSHGIVLDMLYRTASRLPLDQARGFALLNASVNTFRYDGRNWQVTAVGDVSHLTQDAVTQFGDANV